MSESVLVTNPARPREHGSGFVIRRVGDGAQVVTCAHVVRALGTDGLQVAALPATVVSDLSSQGVDLAVLLVPGLTEAPPFDLARGVKGDLVTLLGFEPGGGGPVAVPRAARLAAASVTALGGRNRPSWQLELEAGQGEIEGGHSGGPVVHRLTGKVVAVVAMGPDKPGGRDGVAVAIENLRLWSEAPSIGPAAAHAGDSSDGEADPDEPGPSIVQPVRRWWKVAVVAGGLAVAAAALAVSAWPSSVTPSGCAIPDVRELVERFDTVDVVPWCPDAIDGETACVRRFDDGSVISGRCRGTDAIGLWTSRDPQGVERWRATFGEAGTRPAVVFEHQHAPSRAVHSVRVVRGAAVSGDPTRTVDTKVETYRCSRSDGDSTVTWTYPDLAEGDADVTLSVPGGVMHCALHRDATTRQTVATMCAVGLRKVLGPLAADAYSQVLDLRVQIENCLPVTLPPIPGCGDGIQNSNEACDTGGMTALCDGDCTAPKCGDGLLNTFAGEQCELGPGGESPQCNADCTVPRCGDGKVNRAAGETCEPRAASGTSLCDADCTAPRCGDGVLNRAANEDCDTGGRDTAECVGRTCRLSRCGDRITNPAAGEACDTGVRSRTCTADCKLPADRLRPPGTGSGSGR